MSNSTLDIYNTVAGPYANQEFADAVIGSQLLGSIANLLFWGFSVSQFIQYLSSPRHKVDSIVIKSIVYSVMFLASMQTTFHFFILYDTALVVERTALKILTQSVIGCLDLLPVSIEGAIVQSYLSFRASLLFAERRTKIVFLTICGIGITFGLFGGFAFLILAFMRREGTVSRALPLTPDLAIAVFLYACASIDILVTVVLCFQLQKNIKGFKENTDGMLRHLIKLAIASASYTAVFASIPALLIVLIPKSSLSYNSAYSFPIPLSSFYAISLLHNLLSTSKIRTRGLNDGYTTNKGTTAIHTWNGNNPKISVIPVVLDNNHSSEEGDFKGSVAHRGVTFE